MIEFISYYPAKNQTNVGINENITAVIRADFELDPRDVKFKIYGVEVIPEIYTVYYGASHYELKVVLYSKKRIKYATEKRYGQEGLRYGMTDIFPSMLNYGARYSIEIISWGTNSQGVREEAFERFAFTTEEGIFLNEFPPSYFYSPLTQALANYFPDWSKTRYDKYSVVQQITNPMGIELEKISDFIVHHNKNYFIQTADLNELHSLYKAELGKDYPITELLAKSGESYYVQPDIQGIAGITKIDLYTRDANSVIDLKGMLPTRLDIDREEIHQDILHEDIIVSRDPVAIPCDLLTPRFLFLYIDEVESSIYQRGHKTMILYLRLKGQDKYNEELIEDILVLQDRPLLTKKEWKRLETIELLNANTQSAKVTICIVPRPSRILVDFKQQVSNTDLQEFTYWGLRDSALGSVLQKRVESGKTLVDFLKTAGKTEVEQEYHLVDIDNETPVNLKDFTLDPFLNYLYGIDNDYLYIYDKREEYVSYLKDLPEDNGEAELVISVEDDGLGLDPESKEVLFKVIHRVPGTIIIKYRIKIIRPDKTEFYLTYNNEIVTDKNLAVVLPNQNTIMIPERQHSFVANQKGTYSIELEILPKGKSFSFHIQKIQIRTKQALAKYKLNRILSDSTPLSIGYYDDHKIKIFDDKNVLNTLLFRKDGVVIDYAEKILYFIEDYELIEVE